ncbi:alpha/beta fold hydrolase [Janibacter melonis]|uniref:alpha/beta fold hydrolase n=1 Tax=Janibacter melonis TaxID=262209 RepID=UPI001748CBF3|nr:hydrolase [Janibacter melonis]
MRDLDRPVAVVGADRGHAPDGVSAVVVTEPGRARWASRAAQNLMSASHVIAVGADAPGALSLAADHAEHVVSLVLVDPEVDLKDPEHAETMRRVGVPTLVIASAPTPDASVEQSQSIAGGVDNGVFVIIDGADAPMLVTRPTSVLEWSSAFMEIAEGLAQTRTDLVTTPDES